METSTQLKIFCRDQVYNISKSLFMKWAIEQDEVLTDQLNTASSRKHTSFGVSDFQCLRILFLNVYPPTSINMHHETTFSTVKRLLNISQTSGVVSIMTNLGVFIQNR